MNANNVTVLNLHYLIATASDFRMPVWRTMSAIRSQSHHISWLILRSMEKILWTMAGRGTQRLIMKMDISQMHRRPTVITTTYLSLARILQIMIAIQQVHQRPQQSQNRHHQHFLHRQRSSALQHHHQLRGYHTSMKVRGPLRQWALLWEEPLVELRSLRSLRLGRSF